MYNIDIRKNNLKFIIPVIIFIITLILSIIFYINGYKAVNIKNNLDANVSASIVKECKIVEDERECVHSYQYTVDNYVYACPSLHMMQSLEIASDTLIYYDSNNPSNCIIGHDAVLNSYAYLVYIPLLILIISLIRIGYIVFKIFKIKKLLDNNKLIKNVKYEIKKTHVKLFNCEYVSLVVDHKIKDDEMMELESEVISLNKVNKITSVDIIIDTNKKYYVFINN